MLGLFAARGKGERRGRKSLLFLKKKKQKDFYPLAPGLA
jgi:hypothetical protein